MCSSAEKIQLSGLGLISDHFCNSAPAVTILCVDKVVKYNIFSTEQNLLKTPTPIGAPGFRSTPTLPRGQNANPAHPCCTPPHSTP